jgi:RNA recognition motif-containing protein
MSTLTDAAVANTTDNTITSKFFIGRIKFDASSKDLEEYLRNLLNSEESDTAQKVEIVSVNIIHDRESGRSKGFGFVEIRHSEQYNPQDFVESTNGKDFMGMNLVIDRAKERN